MTEQTETPAQTTIPTFSGFGNFQFSTNLFAPQEQKEEDSKTQLEDIEAEDESIQFTPLVHLEEVEQKKMEEDILFN